MLKRVCRVVSSEDEGENVNTPKEKHKKRLQELANKVNQVGRNYSFFLFALGREGGSLIQMCWYL